MKMVFVKYKFKILFSRLEKQYQKLLFSQNQSRNGYCDYKARYENITRIALLLVKVIASVHIVNKLGT